MSPRILPSAAEVILDRGAALPHVEGTEQLLGEWAALFLTDQSQCLRELRQAFPVGRRSHHHDTCRSRCHGGG
jgi:hypothetical protein